MVLHNDYGSQFLYLLIDNNQGTKNMGTFGEYAFIPHTGIVLDPKDAKMTKTRNNGEKRVIVAMKTLKGQLEVKGLFASAWKQSLTWAHFFLQTMSGRSLSPS